MRSKSRTEKNLRALLELLKRSQTSCLDEFIQGRLRLIEERYRELGNPDLGAASQEGLLAVACRLGYVHSTFESLFRRVSSDFRLSTRRPILERMRMDLSPVRPAVIDDAMFERLDALARFRHWFLHLERPLEEKDVAPALHEALELRAIYRPQLEAFLEFLRRVR